MKNIFAVVVGLLVVSPVWAQDRAESAELLVGLASGDVTPVVGVPLAGYGGGQRRIKGFWDAKNKYPLATFLMPSTGIHDPIHAKVMVLKKGHHKVAFISVDLVGATADMIDEMVRRAPELGYHRENLIVSATHSHSGPGTLSRNPLWEVAAMDRYRPKIRRKFINDVLNSLRAAEAALEPADLYAYSFQAHDIQRNRRGKEGWFDSHGNVLLAKNRSGRWLGGMVNLPVHGTALGTANHLFSADVAGGIEKAAEERLAILNSASSADPEPTVLFINGAEGDVAPTQPGFQGIENLGQLFADQMMASFSDARLLKPEFEVRSTPVTLGLARVKISNCIPKKNKFRPPVGVPLSMFLPLRTHTTVVRIGDMLLMTWPGEATTSMGLQAKEAALQAGASQAWVLGLTNDYLSYFTTAEEYAEGTYEACSSFYGPHAGERVLKGLKKLMD